MSVNSLYDVAIHNMFTTQCKYKPYSNSVDNEYVPTSK